jgi:hypothetical protein
MKEFLTVTLIILVLGGITLNVMACDSPNVECGPEDDLTGC